MEPLPVFDTQLCPKCASDRATTRWCANLGHAPEDAEHHHRVCMRCDFEWLEDIYREPPPRRRPVDTPDDSETDDTW